ncbi:hypothetical protein J6590_004336 [Homalodisca vitripennis]|nr:hypothetical protein J6590_004336 [Homalodisca vitripennis]
MVRRSLSTYRPSSARVCWMTFIDVTDERDCFFSRVGSSEVEPLYGKLAFFLRQLTLETSALEFEHIGSELYFWLSSFQFCIPASPTLRIITPVLFLLVRPPSPPPAYANSPSPPSATAPDCLAGVLEGVSPSPSPPPLPHSSRSPSLRLQYAGSRRTVHFTRASPVYTAQRTLWIFSLHRRTSLRFQLQMKCAQRTVFCVVLV